MIHTPTEDLHQQIQPRAARDAAFLANPSETPSFDTLAARAFQFLLTLTSLTVTERNRVVQQTAAIEDRTPWALGGFSFSDGSVLRRSDLDWQSPSATEARTRLDQQSKQPLEVRLRYAFQGGDGRQKCTVTEARFSFQETTNCWQLVIEYEAYMDSPLYGFQTDRFADLAELNLRELRVDAIPYRHWQLEQIALHPDWLELMLISRRPD